jgi:hypothetical protein
MCLYFENIQGENTILCACSVCIVDYFLIPSRIEIYLQKKTGIRMSEFAK